MSTPNVSVCILSHRPELLPRALNSVHRQTYRDFQILVSFAEAYWPDKLNDVMRAARGRWLVPLCDDDELAPTFLERHVTEGEKANADLVFSDIAVLGKHTQLIGPVHIQLPEFDAEVLRMHCVPFFTALVSRELFNAVGGYDGEQPFCDYDLWLRFCQAGAKAVHLRHEYLFQPHSHQHNGSRVMDADEAWRKLRAKHSALIVAN
jgi:glycosyltransferase involved in cell wall biosynthesis